jgi:hypothetical protein
LGRRVSDESRPPLGTSITIVSLFDGHVLYRQYHKASNEGRDTNATTAVSLQLTDPSWLGWNRTAETKGRDASNRIRSSGVY